jgi:hypothetical protein
MRIEQIELPRSFNASVSFESHLPLLPRLYPKNVIMCRLEGEPGRTHSCRHVSTRSRSRFSTIESVTAPWLYRKKFVFSSTIPGWKYARRLEKRIPPSPFQERDVQRIGSQISCCRYERSRTESHTFKRLGLQLPITHLWDVLYDINHGISIR